VLLLPFSIHHQQRFEKIYNKWFFYKNALSIHENKAKRKILLGVVKLGVQREKFSFFPRSETLFYMYTKKTRSSFYTPASDYAVQ
jgi:hypothetical protein